MVLKDLTEIPNSVQIRTPDLEARGWRGGGRGTMGLSGEGGVTIPGATRGPSKMRS